MGIDPKAGAVIMVVPDKKICELLAKIEPGKMDPIFLAVRDARKRAIPLQSYVDHISPARMAELTYEQRELLESGDPSKVISSSLDASDPISFLYTANLYFNKFKIARKQEQIFLFEVTDASLKTVVPLHDGDYQKILIREASRRWLKDTGEPLPPSLATLLLKFWYNHTEQIPIPDPMGRPNEDNWCLHRSEYEPDASVKYESWQRILARISDPAAFAAWIYGVYYGVYKGRQILWLHGPHGEDGKSTMASIIGKFLFGPAHNAISNASISSAEKRFLASFFEFASLVIYPDANNRKCLMSENFKSVASAGSDPILIERKGRQAYTSTLQARMWVCSNYSPEITNDNFVTSRLLYVYIEKMTDETPDPTVFDRLKEELPGFLAYAKECYEERCSDNYKVITDQSTTDAVKGFSDDFYDEFEIIFSKYFEKADSTQRVEASKVRDAARTEGLAGNINFKNFVEWMRNSKGVQKRKISNEHGKVFYYGMRRIGDGSPVNSKPEF